jgi:uncharacterized protein YecE (DUF72 family)
VKTLAAKSEKIFLGTSGWSYRDWIGPFYTSEDKSMLHAYTRIFRSVEIDSTFYRYPTKGTVMGWVKYSPEGFVYTAKMPRLITHEKKLDVSQGAEQDLQKFVELIEPLYLSGKLGCILIQLPPKYEYKPNELEAFFEILPTHIKFAVEFREESWMREETWNLLKRYQVAYTIVDEPLLPPEIHVTSSFAYFRWHGHGARPWYNYRYKPEELKPWIPKITETAERVEKVYGYFNNHYHGYAVENCLQVLEMLGIQTPEQVKAKNNVEDYLETSIRAEEPTLETYVGTEEMTFEALLRSFLDRDRLKRAQHIKESELEIQKETEDRIEAKIRQYHILIDIRNQIILHDCADWGRVLASKHFCKHLGRLMLSLNMTRALTILRRIYGNKEAWNFKPYIESNR